VLLSESADGKTLLVGKKNGNEPPYDLDYSLWDTATDSQVQALPELRSGGGLGNIIFGEFTDGTVGTYDIVTKQRRTMPYAINWDKLSTMNVSRDGAILLLGDQEGRVVDLDLARGTRGVSFTLPDDRGVAQLAITDDHSRIYAASFGLFAFDGATGTEIARVDGNRLNNVAVSPRGDVVGAMDGGELDVYDPNTLTLKASLAGARGLVSQLRFSDDGKTLLAASDDGTLSLYDMGTHLRLGDAAPAERTGFDFRPIGLRVDGADAVVPSLSGDGAAIWDLDPDHWVTAACSIARRNLTRDEWKTYIGDLGSYRATCPEFPVPP
jgi:WD40 repeat protein